MRRTVPTDGATRRRTGWPTSSDGWRRSAPPRLRWRRRRLDPPDPEDESGPGASSGMRWQGRPLRGEDGTPPDRAQRNFTDPDSRILPSPRRLRAGLQRPDRGRCRASGHRRAPPRDQRGRLPRPRAADRRGPRSSRAQAAGGLGRCRLCQRGEPRRAEGAADHGLSLLRGGRVTARRMRPGVGG